MSETTKEYNELTKPHCSHPIRVQRKRVKGWRMPPNTVSVCRPGKWGNPFKVGIDGNAAECVEKFRDDILHPNSRLGFDYEDITELNGKNLACFCRLDQLCHADVLLYFANHKVVDSE